MQVRQTVCGARVEGECVKGTVIVVSGERRPPEMVKIRSQQVQPQCSTAEQQATSRDNHERGERRVRRGRCNVPQYHVDGRHHRYGVLAQCYYIVRHGERTRRERQYN